MVHRHLPKLSDDEFRYLQQMMVEVSGIHMADSKRMLVAGRLMSRLRELDQGDFYEYVNFLRQPANQSERRLVIDLLTTNETYFFREPAHFDLLAQQITQGGLRTPRVWSAAASFGDEAWSITMLLADLQQQGRVSGDWGVLATDISDRVLRSAKQAIYPAERLRHVSPERLRRHCLQGVAESAGLVQIHPRLHSRVQFGQLNLCKPIEALGPFDVVFLRNVLIYFDLPTKCEVVDRVASQLRPGGLLFIGTAEGRVPCKTALQVLAPGAFRKLA
jgi:chemotaxis protein methyltransferase CheR